MEQLEEQIDLNDLRELDPRVLAIVYDRYSPMIYQYAARQLGDPDLAEECVAETFSRLLKALSSGHGPREFLKAYLFKVAHNWITDTYRRQPSPPDELDEELAAEGSVEAGVEAEAECKRVRRALRQLTPDQRQVIMLRFIEGWDLEETAAALRKPLGAIKALQHRAVAALRRLLQPAEREEIYEFQG